MEDTLLRLRDENLSLKKQNNELADQSKRLAAKLNIMDISMHKVGGGGSATTALKTEIAARQLQEELESVRRQNKQLQAKLRHQENDTTIKAIIQGRTVPYGRLPRPVAGKLAVGIDVGIPGSGGAIRPPSRSRSRSRSVSRERGVLDDSSLHYQTARALATSGLNVSTAGHGQGRGPGLSASSMASPTAGTPAAPPVPPATPGIDPALHARLINAESSAAQLRSENAALRSQLASSSGPLSPLRASNASALNASAQSGGNGHTIAIPRGDLIELERQLKEKTSQVLLLKSRHDGLEAKAAAERDVYDRTVSTLEEQNAQLRDARSALQAAEADLSILRSRLRGSEDTDVELRAAREEIKRLERALTDLCESPFISEGRDAVSKRQRLESAEKELSSLKDQVTHLQHTVRSQHSELTILRKEKRELADAAERLKEEADKARMAADTSGRAAALMRERLALYSGVVGGPDALTVGGPTPPSTGAQPSTAVVTGGGKDSENLAALMSVPSEELQRALVLVRKRLDTPGSAGAGGPAEDNGPDAVPALRRKVQQLQLALVSSQRELERCEAMLKAQTTIAADLGAEVAELNQRLGHEGLDLRKRLADTEALAERRLQRVQLLEAQVRQLLSKVKELQSSKRAARSLADTAQGRGRGAEKSKAGARAQDDDDDASTVISDLSGEGRPGNGPEASAERIAGLADMEDSVDLSSSLLDVGPGEAALEVYVIEAHIDPTVLGRHDTTFALLDFYDFESQSSPLASGTSPYYNFSAQYRVTVDPFFLRHVAGEAGGVRVDVHQAKGSDFQLVARAQLPLRKLLLSSVTKARYTAIPLLSRDGRIVGHMRAEIRTGASLAPLWETFCKSKPAEGAALTAAMRSKETMAEEDALLPTSTGLSASGMTALGASSSTTLASNANELAVTVVAASGLRSSIGMHAPSVYVQYTLPLPGLAPVSTPIASDSSNPVYSDARSFPLTVTQRTLAQLAATPLMFSVYEESTHARSVSKDSARAKSLLLGTAAVSLAVVAEGGSVDGTYDIVDSRGVPAGKLQVRIAWAHSLSFADAAASNTMSRGQVQSLASIVDKDGSGVKIGLLCTRAGMTTAQARAVAAVRDALAASLRGYEASSAADKPTGSSYSQRHSLKWSEALQGAADGVSVRAGGPAQGQGMLTARAVYDAITAPAVGAALDYSTVEDAVSALTATGSVACAVSDLCDAFSTLTPVADAALRRLRDMVPRFTSAGRTLSDTAGPRKEGVAALKGALESCARSEQSSSSVLGSTLSTSTAAAPSRISRSGLGAALKSLGVVVTEDHGASTGRPRDPRMAPDFYSDPARHLTVEGGQDQEEDISDLSVSLGHAPTEGAELKPTAVSTAATAGAGAHTVTTAAAPGGGGGGEGVTKELRFESGATTPQSAQGPVPVHSVAGPSTSSDDAGITLEVATVGRLSTALQAALPDLPGGQPTCLYLSYTFPAQVKAGSSMLPRTAVYACALPTQGLSKDSVLSVAPHSQCTGAGTAFGQTTTFPLSKGSALSAHILAAFAPKAAPEESDVAFVLSAAAPSVDSGSGLPLFSSPEAVLGRAIFSLDDLLDAGEDVADYSLPIQASQALVGLSKSKTAASGGGSNTAGGKGLTAGSTVAEVTISVSGFALVSGLEKQASP